MNRTELQSLLESILGSRNVYFNPPESLKISYPCFVYKFTGFSNNKADDANYKTRKRYQITLIHKNPDNTLVDTLEELQYCRYENSFVIDNLYHYVYTIYI